MTFQSLFLNLNSHLVLFLITVHVGDGRALKVVQAAWSVGRVAFPTVDTQTYFYRKKKMQNFKYFC